MQERHGYNKVNQRHPLYNALHHVKDRCYNKKDNGFKHYGERGIKVCNEWLNSYKVFIEWAINNGWKEGLFLDRIDVNGNYEPNNCRFIDRGLSARNQRLIQKNNTTGYRGVYFNGKKSWYVRITYNSRDHYLGCFCSPRLAALRYDAECMLLNDGRPMNFIDINRFAFQNYFIK